MIVFLQHLTVWHWVGLGLVLLTAEIAVGTFDLLWIAVAAFVTALFTVLAPGQVGEWQGQLVVFGIISVVFVLMGRTVFRGLRRRRRRIPTSTTGWRRWSANTAWPPAASRRAKAG